MVTGLRRVGFQTARLAVVLSPVMRPVTVPEFFGGLAARQPMRLINSSLV